MARVAPFQKVVMGDQPADGPSAHLDDPSMAPTVVSNLELEGEPCVTEASEVRDAAMGDWDASVQVVSIEEATKELEKIEAIQERKMSEDGFTAASAQRFKIPSMIEPKELDARLARINEDLSFSLESVATPPDQAGVIDPDSTRCLVFQLVICVVRSAAL